MPRIPDLACEVQAPCSRQLFVWLYGGSAVLLRMARRVVSGWVQMVVWLYGGSAVLLRMPQGVAHAMRLRCGNYLTPKILVVVGLFKLEGLPWDAAFVLLVESFIQDKSIDVWRLLRGLLHLHSPRRWTLSVCHCHWLEGSGGIAVLLSGVLLGPDLGLGILSHHQRRHRHPHLRSHGWLKRVPRNDSSFSGALVPIVLVVSHGRLARSAYSCFQQFRGACKADSASANACTPRAGTQTVRGSMVAARSRGRPVFE